MEAIETVKQAAAAAKKPITHIGLDMGRRPNYVSVSINKGVTPRADVLAAMLSACGYVLAAVPAEDVPASALVVDPVAKKGQA